LSTPGEKKDATANEKRVEALAHINPRKRTGAVHWAMSAATNLQGVEMAAHAMGLKIQVLNANESGRRTLWPPANLTHQYEAD